MSELKKFEEELQELLDKHGIDICASQDFVAITRTNEPDRIEIIESNTPGLWQLEQRS